MLSEMSGMVYFLTSAVLFLWFSLLDEAGKAVFSVGGAGLCA